jgi:hypothetical protein
MLSLALKHEIAIYKKFNNYKEFGNLIAFYSPETSEVPHWNLVYHKEGEEVLIDPENKIILNNFYKNQKLQGYLSKFRIHTNEKAMEYSDYFYRRYKENEIEPNHNLRIVTFSDCSHDNFNLFVEIVKNAFSFNDITSDYFSKKMQMISQKVETIFYVAYLNEEAVATSTTYKNEDNSLFIFNMAVSSRFQGNKVGTKLLQAICSHTKSDIYTYSHNQIMRESILPGIGFENLGRVYCVEM